MIAMVHAPSVGNALRVVLMPPQGVSRLVLVRKDADAFSGRQDPDALVIYDGPRVGAVLDSTGLYNGVPVFYRAYYLIGGAWLPTASVRGVPAASFADVSIDPLTIVRNRLDLGLRVYLERGLFSHPMGHIPVMTASPLMEEIPLPVVTIHVASDSSDQRFIGDIVSREVFNPDAFEWSGFDGWYSRVTLTLVAYCLNADERIALRNAMKTVLMSNMAVFDAEGLMQVDMQFSDQEDFVSYAAPIYMAVCNFSCYAPSAVESVDPAVRNVLLTSTF